ncbi:MAG: hypothetical protein CMO26_02485 [Thiotrichales bacterium]|nr:hypothetical protein [Thiotrichales bacterium]
MRSGTTALLLGLLFSFYLPGWLDAVWIQFLPLAALLAIAAGRLRLFGWVMLGFLSGELHVQHVLQTRLAPSQVSQDLCVQGVISSIPVVSRRATRFEFNVEQSHTAGVHYRGKIRLSWYDRPQPLHASQRWRLVVRPKPPYGYANPGGFDYEKWLFIRRIGATGYVLGKQPALPMLSSAHNLARLRDQWVGKLRDAVDSHPSAPLMLALGLGFREELQDHHWATLRATGPSRLMPISGLHVGLVAGGCFCCCHGPSRANGWAGASSGRW